MRTRSPAFLALLLVSLIELVGETTHNPWLIGLSKPLLMPLLAVLVAQAPAAAAIRSSLYTFLAASWVGDVALMLAPERPGDVEFLGIPKAPAWFLVGVLGFTVAHSTLIGLFRRVERPEVPGPFPSRWMSFAPLVVYGLLLLVWILPNVYADPERGVATVPVALYGTLLHTMVAFAIQRAGRVNDASFRITLAGALVFLLSDSCIGVAHLVLHGREPLSGLVIMATYILAQVLLVAGLIRQFEPA
jgi:uncharacterized membrane protein YhhN